MGKPIVFCCLTLLLFACGGGGNDVPSGRVTGGGVIRLAVTNAKAAVTAAARVQVVQYRVIVRGTDFAPIEATFDGTAAGGTVADVPVGVDRGVEVIGMNGSGEAVRAGDAAGIDVRADSVADLVIALDQIPLFAHLAEGSVVPNTRLRLELLGAPGHPLLVEGIPSGEASPVMTDLATGAALIVPPLLTPGAYRLRVRDGTTGRLSEVAIQLIDGTKRRGAPLISGGAGRARVGEAYGGNVQLHASWPRVATQLLMVQ